MNDIATPPTDVQVLIVDDEISIANFQAELLRLMGYQPRVFYDSEQAYEALAKNPKSVDILITDQAMPGMTGTELISKIKNIRPNIPVILCTGYSEFVNESNAKTFGIDAFLTKPIDTQKLLDIMSALKTLPRSETSD